MSYKDNVNHPPHYKQMPNGIEAIDITENFNFNLGNALKYIIRCDHKGKPYEDINKAIWYLHRELKRRRHEERAKEDAAKSLRPTASLDIGAQESNTSA